ncbi:hypothetical protein [Demequina lutea]|uniref:Uncharacterized protein n=1 Tax=Demequina lutea TaxID=431489 RepID=A0A7Y9ZDW9_9MICO|nr:hypothetical protein [Demequina lutea]NYI42205.1 hypothetical protein [Demequina lutea]
MSESTESEEQFQKATLALEAIAEETEHERGVHDGKKFVLPEGQHEIEPLKGPHHTPAE